MSSSNSITRIMTAILLASTTMTIVYVGIPGNMKIAYAGDDSGRSLIEISSVQVSKLLRIMNMDVMSLMEMRFGVFEKDIFCYIFRS